jgi:hypothetical protein
MHDSIRPRGSFASAWALVVLCLVEPSGADAETFTCMNVPDARPTVSLVWQRRCLGYFLYEGDTLAESETYRRLIAQTFSTWTTPACTDLTIGLAGTVPLGFIEDGVPRSSIHAVDSDTDPALDLIPEGAVAITLTEFLPRTGEIIEADTLLDAVHFALVDLRDINQCTLPPENQRPFDLRNIITHEAGHFLGFGHVSERTATMYFQSDPCEIQKRTLDPIDEQGVCVVYPAGQPSRTCNPPVGGYPEAPQSPLAPGCPEPLPPSDSEPSGCSSTSGHANPSLWGCLIATWIYIKSRRRHPETVPDRAKHQR